MPQQLLTPLPVAAFGLTYFDAGKCERFPDGLEHRKSVPYTILAQAVEGCYEVEGAHGLHLARDGEAFLAAAETPLRIVHHTGQCGMMRARWMHLHITLFGVLDVLSLLELPPVLNTAITTPFEAIIEELLLLQDAPFDLCSLAQRQALAFHSLELLCRIAPVRADASMRLDRTHSLLPALAYIRDHLCESLSIEELAAQVALSPSRFHTVFKAAFGCTPMAYVHRQRLAAAWQLLMTGDQSLHTIAAATGFCNAFHLSRAFKLAYGYSPTQYRKTVYPG